MTATDHDLHVQSIAHGVIMLQHLSPEYGAERRRLRVIKYRGRQFRGGLPRLPDPQGRPAGLPAADRGGASRQPVAAAKLESSVTELDDLLGGGIEEGTSTLIVGGAGTGKSTIARAILRGGRRRAARSRSSSCSTRVRNTLFSRCAGLGIDVEGQVKAGLIEIVQVDPAELSPGEFAHLIREAVEACKVKIVVVDSLNGYLNAMPEERFLTIQLHELLMYLVATGRRDAADRRASRRDRLADAGAGRRQLPRRRGDPAALLRIARRSPAGDLGGQETRRHARTHHPRVRRCTTAVFEVGEALREFRGVLTGVPVYEGPPEPLLGTERRRP